MREIACFDVFGSPETLLAKPQPRYMDILHGAHKSDFYTKTTVNENSVLASTISALGTEAIKPVRIHR